MKPHNPDLGLGIWLDTCPVCGNYREASEIEVTICVECYSYFHRSKYTLLEDWLIYRIETSKYKSRTEIQKDRSNQRKRQKRADVRERLANTRLNSSEILLQLSQILLKSNQN